jgi:anti-anti-sigma factor
LLDADRLEERNCMPRLNPQPSAGRHGVPKAGRAVEKPETLVAELGDSLWLVTLTGEHDVATAGELEAALEGVSRRGTDVIVDLTEATFIDSSTLQAILRHDTQTDESVVVVAPAGTLPRRLLDLAGIDQVISVTDARDDALRLLGRD